MDGETTSRPDHTRAQGGTSVAEAARQHGLTVAEVEGWHEQFLRAAENDLRRRPKDEDTLKEEQIKKLKKKIGEFVLENGACHV